jgi:23S rRNA (cytidine1920-2'-O)/16S rRNA (cytidine1409-2'-O)-methyltransferase
LKQRIDKLLLDRRLAPDLKTAQALIGAGDVYVDETVVDKAGSLHNEAVAIRLKARCPFVSRGGFKIAAGLDHFDIDVTDTICLDIGASSGGFTDCLLQRGARRVYAIDVAYGQLAWKIRQDPRVVVLERFNARKLQSSDIRGEQIDLAVMDVSFISITKILPAIFDVLDESGTLLTLIKPQFELPRSDIGKGGVVRTSDLHDKAINKVDSFISGVGFYNFGVVTSPVLGPKGNTEFLMHIKKDENNSPLEITSKTP